MFWLSFAFIMGLIFGPSLVQAVSNEDRQLSPEFALLWFVASMLFVFGLSKLCWSAWWKRCTRRRHKEDYCRYKRWGMVNDVFGNEPRSVRVALAVGAGVSVLFTTFCAISALGDVKIIFDDNERLVLVDWLIYLLFVSVSGFAWVPIDRHDVEERIKRVECLGPVFLKQFPASELLSMSECLRAAPDIFWKEYAELPDRQVNEATNRKFRDRASPYQARRSEAIQRVILLVGVAAILLAVLSLALDLLGGTIVDGVKMWIGLTNAE